MVSLVNIARQLHAQHGTGNVPPIIAMTDRKRQPDVCAQIHALPYDSLVVFRDYDHPDRMEYGRFVRALCYKRNIPMLVAGDVGMAKLLRADGVHVPQYLLPKLPFILKKHPRALITVACHDAGSVAPK